MNLTEVDYQHSPSISAPSTMVLSRALLKFIYVINLTLLLANSLGLGHPPDITLFSQVHELKLPGASDLASFFFAPGMILFIIYIECKNHECKKQILAGPLVSLFICEKI